MLISKPPTLVLRFIELYVKLESIKETALPELTAIPPATFNLVVGVVVPIPTFPPSATKSTFPLELKCIGNFDNTGLYRYK